jgi:hypothetical protein
MLKGLTALASLFLVGAASAQSDPPVKMSSNGICHAQGTTYYAQTKKFTPYKTLDDCLKAGGRMPKR